MWNEGDERAGRKPPEAKINMPPLKRRGEETQRTHQLEKRGRVSGALNR